MSPESTSQISEQASDPPAPGPTAEHFCTLFDANFLPLGMVLHQSLMRHAGAFHLWILCMDERVERQLEMLALDNVTLIRLRDIESKELLQVKPTRSAGEYCWTMTPFIFQAVFDRAPAASRVTYLDADLYLLDRPEILLAELDQSQKHVLITENAYGPEFEYFGIAHGRFCVQFLTFSRDPRATRVMRWWQERCVEWCFDRDEDGKFGDQKYLDHWPGMFPDSIHIVQQTHLTLAPWNVEHFARKQNNILHPVFYHFHMLRIVAPNSVRLFHFYHLGRAALGLYDQYLADLSSCAARLEARGIPLPVLPFKEPYAWLRHLRRRILGDEIYSPLKSRRTLGR